jgi:hypothetical protein
MSLKSYGWNILIGVDQLLNAVLAGDPDETISGRIGKVKLHHGGRIPWRRPVLKITDWLLERIDKNHTIKSIEDDEGKDEIWNWRK